ncbi:MAG: ATP-binding protein [Sulfolobales archaeon]
MVQMFIYDHVYALVKIFGFSQKYIYNEKIKPVKSCDKIKLKIKSYSENMRFLDPDIPAVFLHVDGIETVEKDGSRANEIEARVIKKIVSTLKEQGITSERIGIITPYRAQRRLLKETLKDETIEINTVDAFQGREKDVIIFSITSTEDLSFVEDENRLNVAFTRARKKLIVIGNIRSIETHGKDLLPKFVSYIKQINGLYYWSSS